jgi:hypothetical protein
MKATLLALDSHASNRKQNYFNKSELGLTCSNSPRKQGDLKGEVRGEGYRRFALKMSMAFATSNIRASLGRYS